MWIVLGDDWFGRAFNRRKYNEVPTERELARRKKKIRQRSSPHLMTACSRESSADATLCTANVVSFGD